MLLYHIDILICKEGILWSSEVEIQLTFTLVPLFFVNDFRRVKETNR
jgi:hypothetical protein